MDASDDDHIILSHIPENSIQNLKENGNFRANIDRYNHLLQVTVRDYAILYDLDYLHGRSSSYDELRGQEFGIPEVSYLDEMDQFIDPRKFVNTGFNIETSSDDIDGENRILNRFSICANEHSTLYFGRQIS